MYKYGHKMSEKKQKQDNMANKISEMEQREMALIEKLKVTQQKQRQAYGSLENMVQVGYGYYGQSYELMRKKQADLLPNYKAKSPSRSDVKALQSNPGVAEIYLEQKLEEKSQARKKKKKVRQNNSTLESGQIGGLSSNGDFYAAVEGGSRESSNKSFIDIEKSTSKKVKK